MVQGPGQGFFTQVHTDVAREGVLRTVNPVGVRGVVGLRKDQSPVSKSRAWVSLSGKGCMGNRNKRLVLLYLCL